MMMKGNNRRSGRARPPSSVGRPLSVIFLGLTLALGASIANAVDSVDFTRVRPAYREAKSFKRISEYFTGRENTGKTIVFRTQKEDRNGFYFSFRIETERGSTVPSGTIVLQLYAPGTIEPTEYVYELETQDKHWVPILIGLTGTDWEDPEANPVAWHLEFRDTGGNLLGSEDSFLWRLPEKDESEE
ncbi:MAG: hypothetical protein DRQ40_09545 [Gammaproteobacteria bacterium]|nr:MAG: hypothetical protein DRQ40_09545 [Gammaproteobacteria bacterium]